MWKILLIVFPIGCQKYGPSSIFLCYETIFLAQNCIREGRAYPLSLPASQQKSLLTRDFT